MTSKKDDNENDYAWRRANELCEEVGLNGEDAKISKTLLARLHRDPTAAARFDAPPGYEDRLVAALMAKAQNEVSAAVVPAAPELPSLGGRSFRAWERMAAKLIPATGFAFALVIGLAVVQHMVKSSASQKPANDGLWAKAVEDASVRDVSRWVASVADVGTSAFETSLDLELLSAELSEAQLEQVLKNDSGS